MSEARMLHEKAAKSRRLALRAAANHRFRRSEALLKLAEAFEQEAAEAEAREREPHAAPVHPFVGAAPRAGDAGAAVPPEKEGDPPSS